MAQSSKAKKGTGAAGWGTGEGNGGVDGATGEPGAGVGGGSLKEWGQGKPLFGVGGLELARGKLGITRGAEDLRGKTGMGRRHVAQPKEDAGGEAGKPGVGDVTMEGGAGAAKGRAREEGEGRSRRRAAWPARTP